MRSRHSIRSRNSSWYGCASWVWGHRGKRVGCQKCSAVVQCCGPRGPRLAHSAGATPSTTVQIGPRQVKGHNSQEGTWVAISAPLWVTPVAWAYLAIHTCQSGAVYNPGLFILKAFEGPRMQYPACPAPMLPPHLQHLQGQPCQGGEGRLQRLDHLATTRSMRPGSDRVHSVVQQ